MLSQNLENISETLKEMIKNETLASHKLSCAITCLDALVDDVKQIESLPFTAEDLNKQNVA